MPARPIPIFFREGKARVIKISTMKRKMGELTQLPEVRGCGGGAGLLFFPANMRMRRTPPTVPTIEPITGRDMAFFFN